MEYFWEKNGGKEISEEIVPDSSEKYCIPEPLRKISVQGISYFPPIKENMKTEWIIY